MRRAAFCLGERDAAQKREREPNKEDKKELEKGFDFGRPSKSFARPPPPAGAAAAAFLLKHTHRGNAFRGADDEKRLRATK